MSPKTVSSCAANPWTVATRLGMRSARRCRTLSTCAQLDLICSLSRTISLRRPAYMLPKMSARMTRTAIMPSATFMNFLRVSDGATPSYFKSGESCSSERVEAAVNLVGYDFYEFKVGVQARLDVYVARLAFPFAHIEQRVKCRGVRASEGSYRRDRFAFGRGHRLPQREERVTEERAESRDGLRHDGQMRFVAERRGQDGLAQAQPIGAQFAFDLQTMQAQRNFEIREEVRAEKQAVMAGNIQQLDGEDVRGTMQFIEREEQRRRIALALPPFRGVVEVLQIFRSRAFDHAENVQVRMPRAEFGGDC